MVTRTQAAPMVIVWAPITANRRSSLVFLDCGIHTPWNCLRDIIKALGKQNISVGERGHFNKTLHPFTVRVTFPSGIYWSTRLALKNTPVSVPKAHFQATCNEFLVRLKAIIRTDGRIENFEKTKYINFGKEVISKGRYVKSKCILCNIYTLSVRDQFSPKQTEHFHLIEVPYTNNDFRIVLPIMKELIAGRKSFQAPHPWYWIV